MHITTTHAYTNCLKFFFLNYKNILLERIYVNQTFCIVTMRWNKFYRRPNIQHFAHSQKNVRTINVLQTPSIRKNKF